MEKILVEELITKRTDLIMEYITQILSDNIEVSGKMNFDGNKIDDEYMNTLDIYVPIRNFEKHLNLGINIDYRDELYKSILDRVLKDLVPREDIGVSRFQSMRSTFDSFDGINITNNIGSNIKVNMYGIDKEISSEYNKKLESKKKKI